MSDQPPLTIIDDDDGFDTLADEPSDFECYVCGKTCKNARGLSMHLARSHDIRKEGADAAPASLKQRKTNLEKDLVSFFSTIGLFVSVIPKCMADGQIIVHNAENLARAWSHLAQQNKSVERVLKGMMSASASGEVLMAMTMVIVPIMANHEMLPPEIAFMFGAAPVTVPETES